MLGSKFRSEQLRFGDMLAQLQRQPAFQLHQFEVVMDSIRDCVAEVSGGVPLKVTALVRNLLRVIIIGTNCLHSCFLAALRPSM